MERKNKACWNCLRYKAFFTKEQCRFEKLPYGLCGWKGETVQNGETCTFWVSDERKREIRKKVAIRRLGELSESILQLQQILSDDEERLT